MEQPSAKSTAPRKQIPHSPKVVVRGVEIPRPAVPPITPLWRIERAVKIAVQQYADQLAMRNNPDRADSVSISSPFDSDETPPRQPIITG